jgi:hypothetical protein
MPLVAVVRRSMQHVIAFIRRRRALIILMGIIKGLISLGAMALLLE